MTPPVPPLVVVVEAHRIVRASREHLFAYIARPEHLPRFGAPLWLTGDVEERRGGEPLVTLRGYFAGLPVEAVVRSTARSPHSVDITQIRGTLRGFTQRFTIESGDEATLLGCRVEADPGIPMLSDEAVKHFLVQYVERMLDRVRLAAERRAPSRRPLRAAARTEAGAANAEADELTIANGASPEALDTNRGPAEEAAVSSPLPGEAGPPGSAPPVTTDTKAAPESGSPAPGPRPATPRRLPSSRPMRAPRSQRLRPTREPGSAAPATPAQGPPAAAQGPPRGSADATLSGRARKRRRRRRRRGRGPGPGRGPEGGPGPSSPEGGDAVS